MYNKRLRWVFLPVVVLVIATLSCGGRGSRGQPGGPPAPSATYTPTSTPKLLPTSTKTPTPAPAPSVSPESSSEAPAVVEFTDLILGVSAKGYDHYAMGSTAVMGGSDAYFFMEPNTCGMKLEVRTLPTGAMPGATALESLEIVYQRDYIERSSSSTQWTITEQPFELELNGEPAARLEVERVKSESMTLFQITVIRGETRSAVVQGQVGQTCAENPASKASLDEMTDSVTLYEPAPVCYVGFKPGSDPAEYSVSCDYDVTGWKGQSALADRGFTEIELGPVTWDECAAFMRDHDQRYW